MFVVDYKPFGTGHLYSRINERYLKIQIPPLLEKSILGHIDGLEAKSPRIAYMVDNVSKFYKHLRAGNGLVLVGLP